jgi:hypothetical protein
VFEQVEDSRNKAGSPPWITRHSRAILGRIEKKEEAIMQRLIIMLAVVLLISACADEPGSEKWCAAKQQESKSDWSMSDAATYAKNCLVDGMAIGSQEWCEDLKGKPKGEWTGEEAKEYAKYCVL